MCIGYPSPGVTIPGALSTLAESQVSFLRGLCIIEDLGLQKRVAPGDSGISTNGKGLGVLKKVGQT